MKTEAQTIEALIAWAKAHNPRDLDVLIPISDGSDSAFSFWVYNQAFPKRVDGLFFGATLRAESWFRSTGTVRIEEHQEVFPDQELYRYARALEIKLQEKRILIGTRNRTEHVLGAFSLASRVTEYLPLSGMWKSDILKLCIHVGIPKEITDSSRRADPVCGRPEELAAMPFDSVDRYLSMTVGEMPLGPVEGLTEEQKKYLDTLISISNFKQGLPVMGPVLK
jgi:NH3-dependent NAD+ synthetase